MRRRSGDMRGAILALGLMCSLACGALAALAPTARAAPAVAPLPTPASATAPEAAAITLPEAIPVPDSGALPLSSARRPGPEHADLAAAGYEEAEYYLVGKAPAIDADGHVRVAAAPYITRILVRRPADPARFNGTVVIEPFSWFGARAAGWILTRAYLMRRGYAFVAYTLDINAPPADPKFPPVPGEVGNSDQAQYGGIVNLEFMRRFDYARYAPLGSYYDPQRFLRGGAPDPFLPQAQGIGAELALLLRTPSAAGPMAGLAVRRVYVDSWAVQAQVWFDYLDQGRHQQWRRPDGGPLIDAYMTGRFSYGEVAGAPRRIPRGLPDDVPFVTVYSQSETVHDAIEHIALPPDSDRPMLRYVEVMGTPHLRAADLGTGEVEPLPNQRGHGNDPRCQAIYDEPAELPFSALLDAMDRWVRTGAPMPRYPRVVRTSNGVRRDPRTQAIVGGMRPPWITVPTFEYWTDFETGCGTVYDSKRAFSPALMRKLYGSYARYARRFAAATRAAVAAGIILPEDAAGLVPPAGPEAFGPSGLSPR